MDKMIRLGAAVTLARVTRAWLAGPFSAVEEMASTYRILDSPSCDARPAAQ